MSLNTSLVGQAKEKKDQRRFGVPAWCKTGNIRDEIYNDFIDWFQGEYNGQETSSHGGFIVFIMTMKLSSQVSSCCKSELSGLSGYGSVTGVR